MKSKLKTVAYLSIFTAITVLCETVRTGKDIDYCNPFILAYMALALNILHTKNIPCK